MEGLGSSGRLVGSISTYPGTYKCPWSRVMAKNPGGAFFSSVYVMILAQVIKGPYDYLMNLIKTVYESLRLPYKAL